MQWARLFFHENRYPQEVPKQEMRARPSPHTFASTKRFIRGSIAFFFIDAFDGLTSCFSSSWKSWGGTGRSNFTSKLLSNKSCHRKFQNVFFLETKYPIDSELNMPLSLNVCLLEEQIDQSWYVYSSQVLFPQDYILKFCQYLMLILKLFLSGHFPSAAYQWSSHRCHGVEKMYFRRDMPQEWS